MIRLSDLTADYDENYKFHRPGWCGKCHYGLVNPPPVTGICHVSRVDIRLAQAKSGLLSFCDCQAGATYNAYLRRIYRERESGKTGLTKLEYERLADYVELQLQGQEPSHAAAFRGTE